MSFSFIQSKQLPGLLFLLFLCMAILQATLSSRPPSEWRKVGTVQSLGVSYVISCHEGQLTMRSDIKEALSPLFLNGSRVPCE